MTFNVPNAVNYRSPLNAVPLDWTSEVPEGPKGIQCSIAWGTDGGANNSVYLNMQNNATLNFSKVRALIIDNSKSGSDVTFVFPDTETTVTVPSYTPYAIIPVFTNQTQFYVIAPNAESEDITNFMVLNTAPPPLAVPTTQEQNFYTNGALVTDGASGTTQLVAASVSGTIEALVISAYGGSNANVVSNTVYSIVDGLGHVLWVGIIQVPGDLYADALLASVSSLNLRFQGGLSLEWVTTSVTPASLSAAVNIYYRTP